MHKANPKSHHKLSKLVQKNMKDTKKSVEISNNFKVVKDLTIVYAKPNLNSEKIDLLSEGDILKAKVIDNNWIYTNKGYVLRSSVSKVK